MELRKPEIKNLLNKLRKLPSETEWVEFKEAKNNYNFENIGRYFSALSNEANLKSEKCGWLIFGIEDSNRDIVGSNYRKSRQALDSLKKEIADHTTKRITFEEIYELNFPEGRVVMFQIPPAPKGIPIEWKGHYYGRDGESIVALNIQEIERIRNQAKFYDWSIQICEDATIDDLDKKAIQKARIEYKNKNPHLTDKIDKWDDTKFLNKAKITIKGKITNTAILLLGKEESEYHISPSIAKISWILKSEDKSQKDYEHFGPPFLLNTNRIFNKIRNIRYRYMPDDSLFPIEINQYDPYVIREALHNCIAHQDYELKGKINVIEKPDELIFANLGNFIPGNVENVIESDTPPEFYRNRFLAETMVNMNMIDTIGEGIKTMFIKQRERFFPLPKYNFFTGPDKVKVTIFGKILNENYTRILIENSDLDLHTVVLLDRVQKNEKISKEEAKFLRKQNLIEGRYPNLYISSKIAAVTGYKSKYIKHKAFDKKYYKELIISFIKEYGSASRKDINKLLLGKLSDALRENQKYNKIRNLLYEMSKKDEIIKNVGPTSKPKWVLNDS